MAKLKITKAHTEEIETEFDLPVYFHFQDEDCHDEVRMVTETQEVVVKHDIFGFKIEVSSVFHVNDYHLTKRDMTTKEIFDSFFNDAINELHGIVIK